ncbi:hypothetical protein Hdeb2414_s0804g00948771 [Helianthus debilis subsp. tardiflorus]
MNFVNMNMCDLLRINTDESLCPQLWDLHMVRCSFDRCKTNKRFFCGRFRFGSCGLTVAEGARIAGVSRTIIVDPLANRLQEVGAKSVNLKRFGV